MKLEAIRAREILVKLMSLREAQAGFVLEQAASQVKRAQTISDQLHEHAQALSHAHGSMITAGRLDPLQLIALAHASVDNATQAQGAAEDVDKAQQHYQLALQHVVSLQKQTEQHKKVVTAQHQVLSYARLEAQIEEDQIRKIGGLTR